MSKRKPKSPDLRLPIVAVSFSDTPVILPIGYQPITTAGHNDVDVIDLLVAAMSSSTVHNPAYERMQELAIDPQLAARLYWLLCRGCAHEMRKLQSHELLTDCLVGLASDDSTLHGYRLNERRRLLIGCALHTSARFVDGTGGVELSAREITAVEHISHALVEAVYALACNLGRRAAEIR